MARLYTAEELIDIVRARAGMGDAATEGTTDSDILNILNEEAQCTLYPVVQRAREEYFLTREKTTLVSSQSLYRIPARAMQQRMKAVVFIDSDSNRTPLIQIPVAHQCDYSSTDTTTTDPIGYSIEGNYIRLLPLDNTGWSGYLEVLYFIRPSELVLSTACRQITNVNTTTGVVTIAASPTTWDTGDTYDIHSGSSGSELKAWGITCSAINVATTEFTFTAADINGSTVGRFPVAVGDWLCLSETAALPGLPRELHPVLAQAAACRFLESTDPERFQIANAELQALMKRQYELFSDRDESDQLAVPVWNSPHLIGGMVRYVYGKWVN
jgi:hypothetical protein